MLDRLRASCHDEANNAHACKALTQCIARSLEARVAVLGTRDGSCHCQHRGGPRAWTEIRLAIQTCDIFNGTDIDTLAMPDVRIDPRFTRHTGAVHSAFMGPFAGVRIRSQGVAVGTVCVFDARPGAVTAPVFADLGLLAAAVLETLSARRQMIRDTERQERSSDG